MIRFETPLPWLSKFEEAYSQSLTYPQYARLVQELAENGSSTGEHPTESQIEFTGLNHKRMKRWHKTLDLPVDVLISLSHLESPISWLVITEAWCGDAAHALPVMQAMSLEQPLIDLRLVMRDEQPELMDQFLTEGTRSIPKLISVSKDEGTFLGDWGPRPEILNQRVKAEKEREGGLSSAFKQELQSWYNTDKGTLISRELLSLLPLE